MYPDPTESLMLWMLFIMGAVIIIMIGRSTRWFRQWRAVSPDHQERRQRFSGYISARIGHALSGAELDKVIMDEWDDCPDEYRPLLWDVIRQAQNLEESMINEAMQKGVYPRRIVTQGPPIAPQAHPTSVPPGMSTALAPVEHVTWVNGQPLRVR